MLSSLFEGFLPECEHCSKPSSKLFCNNCLEILKFKNACADCGYYPLVGKQLKCLPCRNKVYPWENLTLSFIYQGGVKSWIQSIKDQHKIERLREFDLSNLIGLQGKYDAVLSVSSSPQNQKKRGFDLAANLSRRLSKKLGVPHTKAAFERTEFLESQRKLKREERLYYLKLNLKLSPTLKNQKLGRVLLVDDVMTTGATLEAHIQVLSPLVEFVDVYCLARALKS